MTTALDIATRVAARLSDVDGIVAVVLGGSHARGEADATSDIDLGLYYAAPRLPSIPALRQLAEELDDRHLPHLITELGGWGPWINGGGWLVIDGRRVDWLFRDVTKVAAVIADCAEGRFGKYYQPGHPHAFHTHIYAGEVFYARALHDRDGTFAGLQTQTTPYPPALRAAIVRDQLWEARFALENAGKAPARGDTFYVAGCLFRCAAALVQVVFALNGRYVINEKRAVETADRLPLRPDGFGEVVSDVLGTPGRTPGELAAALARFDGLLKATATLCGA